MRKPRPKTQAQARAAKPAFLVTLVQQGPRAWGFRLLHMSQGWGVGGVSGCGSYGSKASASKAANLRASKLGGEA